MKNSFLIMCIFLYTHFLSAENSYFEWLNKDLRVYEKFDIQNHEVWQKAFTKEYQLHAKINLVNIDLRDIPYNQELHVNGFNVGRKYTYFTIHGTGYVLLYNRDLQTLTRIDRTFYRGYNFFPIQFFKNGKLFSLGGTGFWNVSSVLTYFDFNRKEWEIIETNGNIKPERIHGLLGGYNERQGKIYILEPSEEYAKVTSGILRFFELDVNTFTWTFKGTVDLQKLAKYNLPNMEISWLGSFLLLRGRPENGMIVDPETNELMIYNGLNKLFWGTEQKNFYINNYVYSLNPQFSTSSKLEILDSIPLSQIKNYFVKIDTFYDEPLLPWDTKDISLGFLSVIMLSSSFYIFKLRRKQKPTYKRQVILSPEQSVWDLLPLSGKAILDFVLEHGCDYMFTTEEISVILGCDKKAFDTQRQYRSKFISNFNAFFEEQFQIPDAIYRISSEEDKRFVCYQISEAVITEYRKFINSIN